jgi:uncharacterized membrane protein YqhA
MPYWLHITSLDDLKDRLLGTVMVMLGVSFLGDVVTWDGSTNILALGVAIAVVVASFRLLSAFGGTHGPAADQKQDTDPEPPEGR